jgi:hypothetical protein
VRYDHNSANGDNPVMSDAGGVPLSR